MAPSELLPLAKWVTRVELEVGFVTLRQQAAMCVEKGSLESGRGTEAVWQPFWTSNAGTVFNTQALYRRKPAPGLFRVAAPATLLVLTADDFEAALAEDGNLMALLEPFRPKAG